MSVNFQDNYGLLVMGAYLQFRQDNPPDRQNFLNWADQYDINPSEETLEWVLGELEADDVEQEQRAEEIFSQWVESE